MIPARVTHVSTETVLTKWKDLLVAAVLNGVEKLATVSFKILKHFFQTQTQTPKTSKIFNLKVYS